jgi:formylglycine-generating enzyme required for sulfatase activity
MFVFTDLVRSSNSSTERLSLKRFLKTGRWRCLLLLFILSLVCSPAPCYSLKTISGNTVTVDLETDSGVKTGTMGSVLIHQVVSGQLVWLAIAEIKVISVKGAICTAVILEQKSQFNLIPGLRVVFSPESLPVKSKNISKIEGGANPADAKIEEGKDVFFYLEKANEYQANSNFVKAKRYFQHILKEFPADSMVRRELGRAEEGIREARAKAETKQRRNQLLLNADGLETKGDQAAAIGNTNLALEYFQQILKIVPDDPWILEKKADVLIKAGRKKEAEAILRKILTLHSEIRNIRGKLENLIHDPGELKVVNLSRHLSLKLIYIPAGSFLMGSPDTEKGHSMDEGPRHRVTISRGFWMGKYEVTQAQWQDIMKSNPSLLKPKRPFLKKKDPSTVPHVDERELPVERVSWNDVQMFIRKLNKKTGLKFRLPTEAEWEYACRAGSESAYYFGDSRKELSRYAWYNGNTSAETHPVGRKEPNAWGLCDMTGNVFEWCQDWYSRYFYQYSPATNPTGPSSGAGRVFRGGSWFSSEDRCRSAFRYGYNPDLKYANLGFRLVLESIEKGRQ